MNEVFLNKISGLEKLYEKEANSVMALALGMRYWSCYRIFSDDTCLNKAFHIIVKAQREFKTDLPLFFICVFLNIELGNFDRSMDMLNELKPFKKKFKVDKPIFLGVYTSLLAFLEIRKGKTNAANKHYNELDKLFADRETARPDTLFAFLNFEFREYEDATAYLGFAWASGDRSAFLFTLFNEILGKIKEIPKGGGDILLPFSSWAIANDIPINGYLSRFKKEFTEKFKEFPSYAEKVYSLYPLDWILTIICDILNKKFDYSEKAFYYYKEAEAKQLFFPQLSDFLIRAANKNKIYDISRYMMENYILKGGIPLDIQPFVYHLLLTDERYEGLVLKYKTAILEFGNQCVLNKFLGRYYFTVYKFMLDYREEISQETFLWAYSVIKDNAFVFELTITNPKIKFVLVHEKEKKEGKSYEVKAETLRVLASGYDFKCHFFGDGMRSIICEELRIARLVENADIELYGLLLSDKAISTELLIGASLYYMEKKAEEQTADSADIFEKTIADSKVSSVFRMQVSATLGNYYAQKNDYPRAVSYFKNTDENQLGDYEIEQMLVAFINSGEYHGAVNLIIKKAHCISDRNLFFCLKKLAAFPEYHSRLAEVAYELTLKSWYDKALIDIVLKNYKGSQDDWQELSRSLVSMSVWEKGLDEIILNNAIWIHSPGKASQAVFWRMFEMDLENSLVNDFRDYMCYEIIINSFKPESETIGILEKLFQKDKQHFTAYALCHVYIEKNVATANSSEIFKEAMLFSKQDGFIFPVLKEIKDKTVLTPYIEKNQPFIYRSVPGKSVYLFYKVKGTQKYAQKKMRYIRFGLYAAYATQFSGEIMEFYFSEVENTGSIVTPKAEVQNTRVRLLEKTTDLYYIINNALIYEQMFKFSEVEEIITERLREKPRIKGMLIR